MEVTASTTDAVSPSTLALRLRTLVLFRDLFSGPAGQQFWSLVDLMAQPTSGALPELMQRFSLLQTALLEEGTNPAGDPWQQHLLDRLLWDDNLFSLTAEATGSGELPANLLAQAASELRTLQQAYGLSLRRLRTLLIERAGPLASQLQDAWPLPERPLASQLQDAWALPTIQDSAVTSQGALARRFATTADWGELAAELATHFAADGCGDFARYAAFRWVQHPGDATGLEPVPSPDSVRLEHLVAYERERELVLSNTLRFVLGAPGNNVLLYGDAGTGKSSLVKALLNEYAPQGLRLIEVSKDGLSDFPYIAEAVRGRRQRFILFVDDLSFEQDETEYKALKALLEGGVQARPENLLIYATSNRRHLVKEQFSDRSRPGDDEVHPHDTAQEKISLSERFGVRVAFLSPEQPRYFAIVEAIARQEGLDMPADELRRRALVWAQWQNGFSGRTARQFVNDLIGEQRERSAG